MLQWLPVDVGFTCCLFNIPEVVKGDTDFWIATKSCFASLHVYLTPATAADHLESWNASIYLHDQHTTSILSPNPPKPPPLLFSLSHPYLPRWEPPSRWPSRAGPAPAGGWEEAGRRVERVQPSAGRRAGPASAGPGRSRGCHRRSTDEGGCVELAPPLQSGCCGSAGVYPDRQSTPRESRDCRREIFFILIAVYM